MTAWPRITGPIVRGTFRQAVHTHGVPASTLTDNGMVFTTRSVRRTRRPQRRRTRTPPPAHPPEEPNHPTTCGKAERFQQSMKKWPHAQPDQPATTAKLPALIDRFTQACNHQRPHRSPPHRATPVVVYTTPPKPLPATSRRPDTHTRVRHDRIDDSDAVTLRLAGRLHPIGIGRAHTRTHVIMLVDDLHVRILTATTGELLRELTIDPTRDHQPQRRNPPTP